MTIKALARKVAASARTWLEDDRQPRDNNTLDNRLERYPNGLFTAIVNELQMSRRAHYVWGVMQAARLAAVLGIGAISVLELGVAGGNGLVALEAIAERVQHEYELDIETYGFDMGRGLPKPADHRDLPNLFSEGDYPMDVERLRDRLQRAHLLLGPVRDTVREFVESAPPPIGFVAFDLDLYTSTLDAFQLLEADPSLMLPRVHAYFDDILGLTYGDCNGPRLAIAEFNDAHTRRKMSPIFGLRHFVPRPFFDSPWTEKMFMAHAFDHPLYAKTDHVSARRLDLKG
jgi:hypothetical protein